MQKNLKHSGILERQRSGQKSASTGLNKLEHSRASWNNVLKKIRQAKAALDVRGNEDWWFRGQSSTHSLSPSLFRLLDAGFNKLTGDTRSIFELEYDLFFEFSCRGPGMQETGLTPWDKLFAMRHHRLPTRLLDWTERLGVAGFFCRSKGAVNNKGFAGYLGIEPM